MASAFALLALGSALCYGAADFIGGVTSRRASTVAIVLISQAAGLLFLLGMLPALPPASPAVADWVWGGVAGLAGGTGVALLYRALAVGVMAVVAPITAVCAVAIPVIAAVLLGERPGVQAAAGIAIALLAIALVSQQTDHKSDTAHDSRAAVGLALASGVLIGVFFLALARTTPAAGLWPLVAARVVSVSVFTAMAIVARRAIRMPPATAALAAGGGVLDMLANVLYLLAAQRGPLTLAVTLSSLYPASTVMLARAVLGERLTSRQWIGVACALIAIVAIVSA